MHIIGEGSAVELLHVHFSLIPPVAFEEVKRRYREESKRLHPDRGGNKEKFQALGSAFSALKELFQNGSSLFSDEGGEKLPRETVDGTPLSGLGLGLGPTTNGRDCPECKHRGYTITKGRERCVSCAGTGRKPQIFSCRSCCGAGKFKPHRSGRVVSCRVCGGTGQVSSTLFNHFMDSCPVCDGSGRRGNRVYAMRCYNCHGTGELEILNPVIPKGRFGGPVEPDKTQQRFAARPPPVPKREKPKHDKKAEEKAKFDSLLQELKKGGVGCRRR